MGKTMVIFCMHTSTQYLHMVDTAYHASLRFITNCKALTHHCEYCRVGWPALTTRRLCHWYTFIYKAIIGLLPIYNASLSRRKELESILCALTTFLYCRSLCPYGKWQKGFCVFCTQGMEYVAGKVETELFSMKCF